jgi:hypothetical protein
MLQLASMSSFCCHMLLCRRAERQALLQYLKEQLVGGFADALQGDIAALERASTQLRQLYDSRDLQVGHFIQRHNAVHTSVLGTHEQAGMNSFTGCLFLCNNQHSTKLLHGCLRAVQGKLKQ